MFVQGQLYDDRIALFSKENRISNLYQCKCIDSKQVGAYYYVSS